MNRARAQAALIIGLAALPAAPLPAAVGAALLGDWSVDCEQGYLRIYEDNGVLMQRGMVTMTELPIPPDVLPPAPLEVRAKGDRLVLMSQMPFGRRPVRGMARAVLQGRSMLYIIDMMGCMGEDCHRLELKQTLRRCN